MKALITTEEDFSAKYFKSHGWDVFLYNSEIDSSKDYEIVYFRDPFNDRRFLDLSGSRIDGLIQVFCNAYSVDGIRSFDDMYRAEDKYFQSIKYRSFMPSTYLPSEHSFICGKMVAKKRVSQRAKDVLFDVQNSLSDEWIIQELIDIREELRVYCVSGIVIPEATIKTSKADGKVKVVGARLLTETEKHFCDDILRISGLDFIGLDIARTHNGDYKLIEVNRSPQFNRFVEYYGENILAGILDL